MTVHLKTDQYFVCCKVPRRASSTSGNNPRDMLIMLAKTHFRKCVRQLVKVIVSEYSVSELI